MYRLYWVNGPAIADINSKEIADMCFRMGEKNWPGQVKMQVITLKETERSYGRDADGE